MNAHTREAYDTGVRMIEYKKELEARESQAQSTPTPVIKK